MRHRTNEQLIREMRISGGLKFNTRDKTREAQEDKCSKICKMQMAYPRTEKQNHRSESQTDLD